MDNKVILGSFEGECADANITNNNGLDITREVWEDVFNSDEYKRAIALKHYIGFLGHPQDVGCMDFRNACIVMTDGGIDDNGKVYGKFDLIDTPVGRVVKAFIDAGVKFGISVRGAGDISAHSVVPGTFDFRGFDLVTFPAFPESIPEYIAASSDPNQAAKYQAICASIKNNLSSISSSEALKVLKDQVASQSEVYSAIEDRLAEIDAPDVAVETVNSNDLDACNSETNVDKLRIAAMTELIKSYEANNNSDNKDDERYMRTVERIVAAQNAKSNALNQELSDVKAALDTANKRSILSSKASRFAKICAAKQVSDQNLKYTRKINTLKDEIAERSRIIASLKVNNRKTVASLSNAEREASNLDKDNERLRQAVKASAESANQYKEAYAKLYCSVVGVDYNPKYIKSSKNVSEIRSAIKASRFTVSPTQVDAVAEPIRDDNDIVIL